MAGASELSEESSHVSQPFSPPSVVVIASWPTSLRRVPKWVEARVFLVSLVVRCVGVSLGRIPML